MQEEKWLSYIHAKEMSPSPSTARVLPALLAPLRLPGLLKCAGAGPDGSRGSRRWGPAQSPVAPQGNGAHRVTCPVPIQRGPTRLLVVQNLHTPTPGPKEIRFTVPPSACFCAALQLVKWYIYPSVLLAEDK